MKGKYLLNVFLVVLILLSVYVIYLGGLMEIDYVERPYSDFVVVGKNYTDNYFSSYNQLVDVESFLIDSGVEGYNDVRIFDEKRFFGEREYYAGKILDRVMLDKLDDMENYSRVDFEEKDYLVYEFPYKNKFSFFVGDFRAYKDLDKDKNNIDLDRVINIHDTIDNKIIYLFEID